MHFQLSAEGQVIVKGDVDVPKLAALIAAALKATMGTANSPIVTVEQFTELFGRINSDSKSLLERIAENQGFATWPEVCELLGYTGTHWPDFSNSHNRGINLALSKILKAPGSKLIWWDDDDKAWEEDGWPNARVCIDGEALRALRVALGLDAD